MHVDDFPRIGDEQVEKFVDQTENNKSLAMGNDMSCGRGKSKRRNYSNDHGVPAPGSANYVSYDIPDALDRDINRMKNKDETTRSPNPMGEAVSNEEPQLEARLNDDLQRLEFEWKPFDEVPKHTQIIERILAGTDTFDARKESGDTNDALIKELEQLMQVAGNDVCADCPTTSNRLSPLPPPLTLHAIVLL